MPVLNQKIIKKSRKAYHCDDCGKAVPVGTSYLYLYGYAHEGEKPYPLRICPACQKGNIAYAISVKKATVKA